MNKKYSKANAATFVLNKAEPLHGWYPYLEGYSSHLVDDVINSIGAENIGCVCDPFCGTGTTVLTASSYGIKSCYCETNPFMQRVIEAKTNCVKSLRDKGVGSRHLKAFLKKIEGMTFQMNLEAVTWDGFEKYFEPTVLSLLLKLKDEAETIKDDDTRNIALVLLASVTVRASKMVRQGDLRFAKNAEKKDADSDIVLNYAEKLKTAINDIDTDECRILAETVKLSDDAREIDLESKVDCVITSPPYLNGTNYIRNTKLELKLLDYVKSEKDLPDLHTKGIIAGINNVSKRKQTGEVLEVVKPYVEKLEPVAYDKRIPAMVAGYFYDMDKVIERLSHALKDKGYFIMDIGDSQFAGVHIPTHELLAKICEKHGFELYDEEILRQRTSKNGMSLSQRLLKFRLNKKQPAEEVFRAQAEAFVKNMPYKKEPYCARNWGHAWHSLCSYHGKLKPSIAHFLVEQFTEKGDVVADPLCGVGTVPLEACLQGRVGIGNDLSELAFGVTKAKIEKPCLEESMEALKRLEEYILDNVNTEKTAELVKKWNDFGYNGKLEAYFHEDTFREVVCAREFFLDKKSEMTSAEAMVFSCLLHVLHGNRPYALSRRSHPLTPYAPTGEFEYKNVVCHIKNKIELTFKNSEFDSYVFGKAVYGDYSRLSDKGIWADAIICSPPFADSIRFYMQNWMRLWLCGWEKDDYKTADERFLDQKQKKDFGVYDSFFEMCSRILKPNGKVILHLGKSKKYDMAEELSTRAKPYFKEIFRGSETVENIEKHGIKDKGVTTEHQYLFLMKK